MSQGAVVVTGIGVVSAAGRGREALRSALQEDRFCGRPWQGALPVSMVGTCEDPIPAQPEFPDDRKADLAFVAADEALQQAGLNEVPPHRRGVFLGTGLSSVTPHELETDLYPHLVGECFDRVAMARDLSTDRVAPRRHMPARVTAGLAHRFGATGAQATNFSACAAAAMAIGEGLRAIRRGELDAALVGGHDSMIHPLGMLSFVVLGAMSATRCRPFHPERDGFMIGEGAGMFVLERRSHAEARGAHILGEVAGVGTSVDAWNPTAPHPEGAGAELSMRRALRDAGLTPADVGYVNCHGTGTPLGDKAETNAVARLFADVGPIPFSTIKGAVGHTIAAAGAVEAAACLIALSDGFLPGTVGFDTQDPAIEGDVVATARTAAGVSVALSNSFGFGGQNCSLVFRAAR